MNPPPPRPTTPRKELQLHGPRPSPLKLHSDSIKIQKPPPHPQRRHNTNPSQHFQQQQHFQQTQQQQHSQPVVIYTVSPKVINTTVNEFMSLVQRLTGPSSSPPGDLSPYARLASIEKTSPSSSSPRHHNHFTPPPADVTNDDFIDSILEGIDIMSQFPGILTPSPATMTPIPSGLFSPGAGDVDPHGLLWQGGGGGVMPSPSSLFSAPLVSPSPSSWDLFQNFYDS